MKKSMGSKLKLNWDCCVVVQFTVMDGDLHREGLGKELNFATAKTVIEVTSMGKCCFVFFFKIRFDGIFCASIFFNPVDHCNEVNASA